MHTKAEPSFYLLEHAALADVLATPSAKTIFENALAMIATPLFNIARQAMLPALLMALLLFSGAPASGQITEKNYRIFDVQAQKEVGLMDIVLAMDEYDVLFFGEEHNDSVAHYLQIKMLESLHYRFGNNLALAMEMFDRDVQTVMNEYLQGSIREKNFKKDARVWSNYNDYRPMVEFAKNYGLPVICANAPSRYTNLAGRKGQQALQQLPPDSKKYMAPLPYDTASGKYYDKLIQISSHVPATLPDTAAKPVAPPAGMGGFNLVMGQSLWDATMAYSIAEYLKKNKGKKLMQVNGRFHSDEGFAIVTQLKKYHPKLRPLIISATSDEAFPAIDWTAYQHLGDYIIITDPLVPRTFEE